jgi:hypothetical protein
MVDHADMLPAIAEPVADRDSLVTCAITTENDDQLDLFGNKVLGFNKRRIPHTDQSPLLDIDFNLVTHKDLDRWQRSYVHEYERSQGFDVGVSFSLYPNGEFTAACTALGAKPQKERKKKGRLMSTDLTSLAKKTMKRAVNNHWRRFDRMFTFTFDPKIDSNVLDEHGHIDHSWAHKRISRVLATVSQKYNRLFVKTGKRQFQVSFIRVSEIQEDTGNIHFHVLCDRHIDIKYLVDLWNQASNSVDVAKIKGLRGLNYLMSYIKKGKSLIYGKRYAISEHLYGEFKPCKVSIVGRHARSIFLDYMNRNAPSLLNGKGYLGDWGFCVPPPDRKGVTSSAHREFILGLAVEMDENGYPEMLSEMLGMDTPF